jgi:HSP20 family protein
MTHPVVPTRECDRLPDAAELFRRFARMAELPAFLAEDMRLDIEENDHEYRVKAEMPGVRKEDVQVTVDGTLLAIRARAEGGKREGKADDGQRTLVNELRHGEFSRAVRLSHEIEEKKVHAKLENGILSLTCRKRASGKQTLVAIQ